MPRKVTTLSALEVKKAKKAPKDYKLFDGDGLYLLVTSKGSKLWYFKYRFMDKEKKAAFGAYPAVTLDEARSRRKEAKENLAKGLDPSVVKKAKKAAEIMASENTFELVTREWHERFKTKWTQKHGDVLLRRLEDDIFPQIGQKPIAEITSQHLAEALQRVANRTLETAYRLKFAFNQIFAYSVVTGRININPALSLKNVLPPLRHKHMAAPTELKDIAPLLRAIEGFEGSIVVKSALKFGYLTFVRPGELRHAEWEEIDFINCQWNIPAHKMKMREPHIVPLSKQALEVLSKLNPITGASKYVFPCFRSLAKPMSENAVNAALRRMGFEKTEIVGHGFRAMARTTLDQVLHYRPDYIEHQLAHAVKDPLGRAYNRTTHLPERREMMQAWGDFLDKLRERDNVVQLRQETA